MKKITTAITLLLFCSTIYAQPTTDADKLLQLEQKFIALENKLFTADSITYAKHYKTARIAYLGFSTFKNKASDFSKNLEKDLFMVQLLGVNNPTSIDLKKRILEDLQNSIVKKIQSIFGKDSTKRRGVINTIRNIFNSPIAQDIVKMIPFGNTLSNILTNVGSIVLPEIQYKQNTFGKLIEFNPDVKSIFENVPVLSDLSKELTPYINFYDSLTYINNKFETGIAIIKEKANVLLRNAKDFENIYKLNYQWKAESDIDALLNSFEKQFIPLHQVSKTNESFNITLQNDVAEINQLASSVIQENEILKKTLSQYETFFAKTKAEYIALLKRYKFVNKVFETMLSPLIAKIESADNDALAVVNNNDVVLSNAMVAPNIPQLSIIELDKQQALRNYYQTFSYSDNSGSEKIKKQIFDK